jgi:hypothetical protein
MVAAKLDKRLMKTLFASIFWVAVFIFIAVILSLIVAGFQESGSSKKSRAAVEQTKQMLHAQGFKTDLSEFDFTTPPDVRTREAALKAAHFGLNSRVLMTGHPNLLEAVGSNSAIVVWRQDSVKEGYRSVPDDVLTWQEFDPIVNDNPAFDAACDAILAGPIRFNLDARGGNRMLLPHLAAMKSLEQIFDSRTVVDVHDGNLDAAWTNLLAATRLVTAWEPEPLEISHLVQFVNTELAFNATWQALQTNGWPDEKLARLQQEWQSVNFFTNLPETAAFMRASDLASCQENRQEFAHPLPFSEFARESWFPPLVLEELSDHWQARTYNIYDDENALLLFYRDRELELCDAVQAPTWQAMCLLPGVTNPPAFFSPNRFSRFGNMLVMSSMHSQFPLEGSTLIARAGTAEAHRRVLIAAIALERYHEKYGGWPATLDKLAPEFLESPTVDFIDGQPLRYRLTDDGHFLLYSIGLDGVDNGGEILTRQRPSPEDLRNQILSGQRPSLADLRNRNLFRTPVGDIVWPLPASAEAIQAVAARAEQAQQTQFDRRFAAASEEEWYKSPLRLARVENILSIKWSTDDGGMTYQGRPVNDDICNTNVTGTNRLSLAELLTPKPVITGDEPEQLTFEVPVSYNMVQKRGGLALLVDAEQGQLENADSGAQMQKCNRATNGDCLLVWHAIFDPPGRHAVQVQLSWANERGMQFVVPGPAIAVITTNLCQLSLASSHFDPENGAMFLARLPEMKANYTAQFLTTNGVILKTFAGSTANGQISGTWNLVRDNGQRFSGYYFNSVFHINLLDSGRSQTLKGP